MEFLISQSQLNLILNEQRNDDVLSSSLKKMKSFTNNMVGRVLKTYDINLKMFLTWGTSIGGLVMPLNEFLKSGNLDLSESERYLVLSGIAFLIFFEGKRGLSKILTTIKENGLEEAFDAGLLKAYQLKDSFTNFLRSTKVITSQVLEIISYAFLIPIIGDVQNIAGDVTNITESSIMIAERLAASGVVLLSREVLVSLFKKLFKKLQ
jgi:hypothetical protein